MESQRKLQLLFPNGFYPFGRRHCPPSWGNNHHIFTPKNDLFLWYLHSLNPTFMIFHTINTQDIIEMLAKQIPLHPCSQCSPAAVLNIYPPQWLWTMFTCMLTPGHHTMKSHINRLSDQKALETSVTFDHFLWHDIRTHAGLILPAAHWTSLPERMNSDRWWV